MNTMSDNKFIIDIGKTIAHLRKIHNLSQEDLAELSDTHRTYLSEVEGGKRNPTITVLKKMVDSFGISMSSFFKLVEEKND